MDRSREVLYPPNKDEDTDVLEEIRLLGELVQHDQSNGRQDKLFAA